MDVRELPVGVKSTIMIALVAICLDAFNYTQASTHFPSQYETGARFVFSLGYSR